MSNIATYMHTINLYTTLAVQFYVDFETQGNKNTTITTITTKTNERKGEQVLRIIGKQNVFHMHHSYAPFFSNNKKAKKKRQTSKPSLLALDYRFTTL